MDIRHLTPDFAVSPQIDPSDMAAIATAGFTCVICNRPDAEIGLDICASAVRAAAEAAGLTWAENIISGSGMTMENVIAQGALAAAADGPVLAYCRSGTRSATAWALSQSGKMATDDILAAATAAGYDLAGLRAQIEALAQRAHQPGVTAD